MTQDRRAAARALPELSDAAAVEALAAGQLSGLGVLYDRYHACVFRFVARATNGAADVEDVVHATFLTAARAASGFDGRQSCRPWLLGIAAKLVHRRNRSLFRLTRMLRALAAHEQGRHWDPHRRLVARDEVAHVADALAKLSEAKRVVILLAEVEGLSCEEIATALGIPVGTVWTRLHHARSDLRRLLERIEAP
jgi:RNA polymerase sigma-70 factor (ECF subfamily)